MSEYQLKLLQKEEEYRKKFSQEILDDELKDPHLTLIDVFSRKEEFHLISEDEEEARIPKILDQHRDTCTEGSTIVSEEKFFTNWKEFTSGLLDNFDWTHLFVAGGAVLACLLTDNSAFSSSDIDVYLYGITVEQAEEEFRRICTHITKKIETDGHVRISTNAVDIVLPFPYRTIQIVLCTYRTPAEILLEFDIDCCAVGFDGSRVWAIPRSQRALTKRYNFFTTIPDTNYIGGRYERRLYKYSKRGFAVAIPELQEYVDKLDYTRKSTPEQKDDAKIVSVHPQPQSQSQSQSQPQSQSQSQSQSLIQSNKGWSGWDNFAKDGGVEYIDNLPFENLSGISLLLRYHQIASRPHRHRTINYSTSMEEAISGGKLKCTICGIIIEAHDVEADKDLKDECQYYGKLGGVAWIKQGQYQDYEKISDEFRVLRYRNYAPGRDLIDDWFATAYNTGGVSNNTSVASTPEKPRSKLSRSQLSISSSSSNTSPSASPRLRTQTDPKAMFEELSGIVMSNFSQSNILSSPDTPSSPSISPLSSPEIPPLSSSSLAIKPPITPIHRVISCLYFGGMLTFQERSILRQLLSSTNGLNNKNSRYLTGVLCAFYVLLEEHFNQQKLQPQNQQHQQQQELVLVTKLVEVLKEMIATTPTLTQ